MNTIQSSPSETPILEKIIGISSSTKILRKTQGYFTNKAGKLSVQGYHRLGWWDKFDSQHPEYQSKKKGKAQAGLSEEVITGELHHIATLQGTHPLSEISSPVILPAIEQSVS